MIIWVLAKDTSEGSPPSSQKGAALPTPILTIPPKPCSYIGDLLAPIFDPPKTKAKGTIAIHNCELQDGGA